MGIHALQVGGATGFCRTTLGLCGDGPLGFSAGLAVGAFVLGHGFAPWIGAAG